MGFTSFFFFLFFSSSFSRYEEGWGLDDLKEGNLGGFLGLGLGERGQG